MTLFDRSILDLPLFEDRHRALADALEAWVAETALTPEEAAASPSERGRIWTRRLGAAGWLDHAVYPDAGRSRPDLRSLCLIREALARLDDLADFAFAIQGLAAAPMAWFGERGTDDPRLAPMAKGELIGSLALSEPERGSDLAGMAVEAVRGERGLVVDGTKTWVSNGTIADHHAALLRTGEGPGGMGLSFVSVPADTPGVSVEEIELLAPRAFSTLTFADAALPADAVIGQPGMGFKYALEILGFYRVTVGSAAIGFARKAFDAATGWARERHVAGTKLIQTQMAMDKLADMATFLDSASLMVARAAWEVDVQGRDVPSHSSMAKLFATDGAQEAVDDAVQLFGAAGLVAGSVPEALYRQIRSLRIYEGTSEIQKLIIAGQIGRSNR
ncbi:MAG: acyl-CoA dehydrogenase family protein [Azospirillaceae bacterium]